MKALFQFSGESISILNSEHSERFPTKWAVKPPPLLHLRDKELQRKNRECCLAQLWLALYRAYWRESRNSLER